MNGASPARARRWAIAQQRMGQVIPTRRGLLERIGAAVEAPFVRLAAWWARGKARAELAGMDSDIAELHDAISFDLAHVFRLRQRYEASPVLQERLARNKAELKALCQRRIELAERMGWPI
jgi:cell division protein FtsB